jgi:drug/metabolite transporter (DMT)-like permease
MMWILYASLTVIFLSLASFLEKNILGREHALQFVTTLAILNFVISIPFLFYVDFSSLTAEFYIYTIIAGVLASMAFLLIAKAIRHTEISSTIPLLALGPIFTVIFAWFFLGEVLLLNQILGILFLLFGAYMLNLEDRHHLLKPFQDLKKSKYIQFIILAMILYGATSVIDRHILYNLDVNSQTYLFFVHLIIAVSFIGLLSYKYDGFEDIKKGFKNAGYLIFLVAGLTVLYRYFQTQAVKLTYVSLVVAFKKLSILIAVVIGGKLFHEHSLLRKFFASSIMLLGIIIMIL